MDKILLTQQLIENEQERHELVIASENEKHLQKMQTYTKIFEKILEHDEAMEIMIWVARFDDNNSLFLHGSSPVFAFFSSKQLYDQFIKKHKDHKGYLWFKEPTRLCNLGPEELAVIDKEKFISTRHF